MAKYLIATHGELAEGFLSSLKIIIGDSVQMDVVNTFMEDNFNLEVCVENKLKEYSDDEQLIVFTDLAGGSVNREFIKYLQTKNIILITGVNLALILSVVVTNQDTYSIESLKNTINEAKDQIVLCNELLD
ncbi:MAG: PTS sugar transporter subunit IIA [Erysipelotrichaceae bacterium]